MKFIYDEAKVNSMQLAEERGTFPFWKGSMYEQQEIKMRNSTLTTIAPTGTISLVADVMSVTLSFDVPQPVGLLVA